MKTPENTFRHFFLLSSTLLLASCGGGVGGSTTSGETPPSTSSIKVMYSKGPVDNGQCTIFDSERNQKATTQTTDGWGDFGKVSVADHYIIECTGGQYEDEATKTLKQISTTLKMRSVLNVNNLGEEKTAVITPITEMAYSVLEANGGTLSTFSQELGKTTELMGLNPTFDASEMVPTINLTSAENNDSSQYGLLLSSISQLQEDSGKSLEEILESMTEDLKQENQESINHNLRTAIGNFVSNEQRSTPSTMVLNSANDILTRLDSPSHSVSGVVAGTQESIVIALNGKPLTLSPSQRSFTFENKIAESNTYHVTVVTPPKSHRCIVNNGTGTVDFLNKIDSVEINCYLVTYSISGNITGEYYGGLELKNGDDTFFVNRFFSKSIPEGVDYNITIVEQPTNHTCTIANAQGTASRDISDIEITCEGKPYTLNGTINNLISSGLELKNTSSGEVISVDATSNTFQFSQKIPFNSLYYIEVKTQPNPQKCTVDNGSNRITSTTNVKVTCVSPTLSVGGSITGLSTGSLVLKEVSSGKEYSISTENNRFTWGSLFHPNEIFELIVSSSPAGYTCTITNGNGLLTASVSNVSITCTISTYLISGSVNGLKSEGLVISNNTNNEDLAIPNGSSSLRFDQKQVHGSVLDISIKTQPAGDTCSISNHTGIVTSWVTNISVVCTPNTYTIGGVVTGISSDALKLKNQLTGETLSISANEKSFTFEQKQDFDSVFNISINTLPLGHTCTISNNSGFIKSKVSNISITCTVETYSIGGLVGKVGSDGLIIINGVNNEERSIPSSGNMSFTFESLVEYGSDLDIKIKTQPARHTCTISNNSGTVTSRVNNIYIVCTLNTYSINGAVSGLGSEGLVLSNNTNNEELSISSGSTSFSFENKQEDGSELDISIKTQPADDFCTLTNGSSTSISSNVTVNIACVTKPYYDLGGSISGFNDGTLILKNGNDLLTLNAVATSFTFAQKVGKGNAYDVSVNSHPNGYTCSVTKGKGTMNDVVSNVAINCTPIYNVIVRATNNEDITFFVELGEKSQVRSEWSLTEVDIPSGSAEKTIGSIKTGSFYLVTLKKYTLGKYCLVKNGVGKISTQDIFVDVECFPESSPEDYEYIYVVPDGPMDGLVLSLNNGVDLLPIFTYERDPVYFTHQLKKGENYSVSIHSQPDGQECTLADETGTVGAPQKVSVSCLGFNSVGGSIEGLTSPAEIELSIGDTAETFTSESFSFKVFQGTEYNIKITKQPDGLHCTIANAHGIVFASDVLSAKVTCAPILESYSIPQVEYAQILSQTTNEEYQSKLIAGRKATIRAFVYAKTGANTNPTVLIKASNDAGVTWSADTTMTCPTLTTNDNPDLVLSYNKADACYADILGENISSDTLFSISVGGNEYYSAPIVTSRNAIKLTLVPVVINGVAPSMPDTQSIINSIKERHPFNHVDIKIHETFTSSYSADGEKLLAEINELRSTEMVYGRFYYGFFNSQYQDSLGFAGLAYVNSCSFTVGCDPNFSALGTDGDANWRLALLHELGHNLSLKHAPCGDVTGVDPDYPYNGGTVSLTPLFDQELGDGTIVSPILHTDIMGYCGGQWFSDYHYHKIQSFIEKHDTFRVDGFYQSDNVAAAKFTTTAPLPMIIVSGMISAEGYKVQPIQSLIGARKSRTIGRYALRLHLENGKTIEHPFEPVKVDHYTTKTAPLHFTIVLDDPGEIQKIEVLKNHKSLPKIPDDPTISALSAFKLPSDLPKGSVSINEDNGLTKVHWDSITYPYLTLVLIKDNGERVAYLLNATGGTLIVSPQIIPGGGVWEISMSDGLKRKRVTLPR